MTSTNLDGEVSFNGLSDGSPARATRNATGSQAYKRAYKACEPCRKNKAKCEISIGMAACVKCQREQRTCIFPAQRSSKRRRLSSRGGVNSVSPGTRDFRLRRDPMLPPLSTHGNCDTIVQDPTFAKNSLHGHVLRREVSSPTNGNLQRLPATCYSPPSATDLGQEVLQTALTSSRDAMGLLFRAAAEDPNDLQDTDAESHAATGRSRFRGSTSPAGTTPEANLRQFPHIAVPQELVEIWNKHRFVRQGWFSPYEAISFIEFFFDKLAPMSPVTDSFRLDRTHHRKFVYDEPFLCCTILSISARHMSLPGPTGAVHSSFIHARLWKHIEHLIQRITFGAEKLSSAKSRTLGSIQALLLIIEWHPRALHFPPENDDWDAGLGPAVDDLYQPQTRKADAMNRWRDDVFEPAKRSDRMSWTLAGLATTLAHELGVFGSANDDPPPNDAEVFLCTRPRIRNLLYFFTTQLSLRLGCTNIFPRGDQIAAQQAEYSPHSELVLSHWCSITKLLNTATQMFFESTSMTRQIISDFRYLDMLEHFRSPLSAWLKRFEQTSSSNIPKASRQILLIEYHYVNVLMHSIAIQALVERINTKECGSIWMQQDFLRREHAQDLESIRVVRESSGEILRIARELSDDGFLTYCPVRVFLRIVASSIFLLKAISLGAREHDANASLLLLERCIEALMLRQDDDVHLSSRYADLIARHVRSFKRKLRPSRPEMINAPDRANRPALPLAVDESTVLTAEQLDNHQKQPEHQAAAVDAHTPFTNATIPQEVVTNYMDDTGSDMMDWLVQPFDPQFPPFGLETSQPASGLAIDSLDFLWNL